jgi:hypothetical protein
MQAEFQQLNSLDLLQLQELQLLVPLAFPNCLNQPRWQSSLAAGASSCRNPT